MAESQDLEQQCVAAFKLGNHDQAVQLLPQLPHLATVTTEFDINNEQEIQPNKDVTLLHLATYNGWLDVINILQQHILVYDCRDSAGLTPLHYAAVSGNNLAVIEYLIKTLGCDPNATTTKQNQPLHVAFHHGHLRIAHYLITVHNCDPNVQGYYGFTHLYYASCKGHMDIIQYLINELGCDPTIPNSNGNLPLHIACLNGHLNSTKYFISEQKCDPTSRGQHGFTPLHNASEGGHIKIIQYLITEQGCDPTTPDSYGSLPLHIACLNGHLNAAKYFISEQKYDPNCRGQHEFTPLHYASEGGHMNIIQYLIAEQSCDPTTPNNVGNLPLHIACLNGHLNVTKYFIAEQNCDPTSRGDCEFTPLHYASEGGHMNIIQYLITELGCDPITPNKNGDLPLHIACRNGHLNAVKYLITDDTYDSSCGKNSSTPLHYATEGGHMNIVQYLITELGCDPTTPNTFFVLPLHIACVHGYFDIVQFLITDETYDSCCGLNVNGITPLHYAAQGGHMNIIQYLITELDCDPTTPDCYGSLPLHIACLNGHLNATKYFIAEQNCDPSYRNKTGSTPLHYASEGGYLNIIQYFINELGCNPSIVDHDSRTVLHWASYHGHISVVQWLLHNTQVDIMAKDINGDTCIDLAKHHYEILKILEPLVDSSKRFPIHKFGKTVFTGNSAAGKTTLAKIIAKRATKQSINWFDSRRKIEDIETHTAGIVPSQIDSWEVGNMVVFDLAGHAEYHSSHSAIMETVMQQSPATFINVLDLRNTDAKLAQQLHYWLNFIENSICRTTIKSCLIVVGSHADLLSREDLQSKSTFITSVLKSRMMKLDFMGVITMDCRKFDSRGTRKFISLLSQCQLTLSTRAPSLSYYCHLLYAFLQSKPEMPYCTLEELISLVTCENCPIPAQSTFLTRLLTALNDKGMVIFLKNQQKLDESWIIVNIEMLLKNINQNLFGEDKSTEKVVTGIIRSSTLKQLFPQHNLEMLIGLLQTLELCHHVNLSGIETNLIETSSCQSDIEKCFFFPSLLTICHPSILPSENGYSFGWCLCCKEPVYQFFTSRFLHVLLLRLAYTFPLANPDTFHHNETRCNVWKNGISWGNEEGIRTIVELVDNQRLLVLVSHKTASRPVECNKHHSAVIRLVLDLQQQFCPNIETIEYLISHSLLKNWTADIEFPCDNDLFPIENVAKSMLLHKPYIFSCNNETSEDFQTRDVLKFELYYQLSPSSVCELMDSSKADEPVSQTLLHEVQTICQLHHLESQTHSCLRKCVDELSLFAGRNPIVSIELKLNY